MGAERLMLSQNLDLGFLQDKIIPLSGYDNIVDSCGLVMLGIHMSRSETRSFSLSEPDPKMR